MPKASSRQKLILVSADYDASAWRERAGESEFESWAAVAQDLWGAGSFSAGQASGLYRAANAITIKREHVIGAIGGALGGLGPIAVEREAAIDVFDCDREVMAYNRDETRTG